MKKQQIPLIASIALACASSHLTAHAEERAVAKSEAVTFGITIENDLFANTDQNYTNGTKLFWDFANASDYEDIERLPFWAKRAASVVPSKNPEGAYGATISIGQNIFTPNDKEATQLIVDDRPYAGWTYLSLALRESRGKTTDTFEFTLGVVGPDSYAEDIQNWVHEKIGSTEALGWDNQLKNELGGILSWRRDTRILALPEDLSGWGADLNASYGLSLGNIDTHARAGADLRFGYNRNAPATPPRIRPSNTSIVPTNPDDPRLSTKSTGLGFYVTVGLEGRYVARNLFVEGNTWADSHGLELEPWVADYYAGATLVGKSWALSYLYTRRSEEFPQQASPHEFGGLTLSRAF